MKTKLMIRNQSVTYTIVDEAVFRTETEKIFFKICPFKKVK